MEKYLSGLYFKKKNSVLHFRLDETSKTKVEGYNHAVCLLWC
jgi:hypothetical protein